MPAFEAQPGMPYWIELATTEARKSSYFYSRIFGWEMGDAGDTDGPASDYRVARLQGMPVAGMVEQDSMPDTWMTYFYTTDIARDSARVAELSGRVLTEPMEVSLGTMALCADVAGGWFGLFQPAGEEAFVAAGEPGTPVWFEYASTSNVRAVADFYGELFSWDIVENEGYLLIMQDGAAFAGMWDASGQIPTDVPSFWSSYLGVTNIAEARMKVQEFGGEILRGPENSPFGLLLTVADPNGAVVTLCEVDEPVDEETLDEAESILHL